MNEISQWIVLALVAIFAGLSFCAMTYLADRIQKLEGLHHEDDQVGHGKRSDDEFSVSTATLKKRRREQREQKKRADMSR